MQVRRPFPSWCYARSCKHFAEQVTSASGLCLHDLSPTSHQHVAKWRVCCLLFSTCLSLLSFVFNMLGWISHSTISNVCLRWFVMSSFHNWLPARCPGSTLPNAYGCSFRTASFATIMVGSLCFTVRSQDIRIQSSSLCCKNITGRILLDIELLAGLNMLCLSSDNHANSRATNLDLLTHTRVGLPSITISLPLQEFSRTLWTIACKLFRLGNLHSTKHPC